MKKSAVKKLPKFSQSLRKSIDFIQTHWQILGKVLGIYILVELIFGSGLTAISSTVANINSTSGNWAKFGSLFGSGSSGGAGSSLPSILAIVELLVFIYLIRQLASGKTIKVKDAYYKSMQPLIPFLLVTLVLILELVPLGIGSAILLAAFTGSSVLLKVIFGAVFIALAGWSFRMLAGSIFALFLVSQPNATPLNSLRESALLVSGHRLQIISRLTSFALVLGLLIFAVLLILIFAVHFLVAPVFYLVGVSLLPLTAIYTYFLYQELES